MFLWIALASAGEVNVQAPAQNTVLIQRRRAERRGTTFFARGLPDGPVSVEIQRGSRVIDSVWVDVPADARVTVEWASTPQGTAFTVFRPEPIRGRTTGRPTRPTRPARPTAGQVPGGRNTPQPPRRGPNPMHPDDFQALLGQLSRGGDTGRLGMMQTSGAHNHFTSNQLAAVLQTFTFDDKKVTAACQLAPRILDPQNITAIGPAFTFSSRLNEAMACYR